MKAELLLLRSAPDTPETAARYVELRKSVDRFEDAGHGACWLADPSIARIVSDNLLHFNGIRYRLLSFCIMPNHVHVLIEVADGWSLSRILHGWRSFTANEANKLLGRTGRFWMEEYFDRYIRDERHFLNVQSYIRMNPVKAGLVAAPAAWPWTWEATGSAGCQPAATSPPTRAGSPRSQAAALPAALPGGAGCQPAATSPPTRAGSPRSQAAALPAALPGGAGCQPAAPPASPTPLHNPTT